MIELPEFADAADSKKISAVRHAADIFQKEMPVPAAGDNPERFRGAKLPHGTDQSVHRMDSSGISTDPHRIDGILSRQFRYRIKQWQQGKLSGMVMEGIPQQLTAGQDNTAFKRPGSGNEFKSNSRAEINRQSWQRTSSGSATKVFLNFSGSCS